METGRPQEQRADWTPSGPSQRPLFRLLAAFGLSVPLVAASLVQAGGAPAASSPWGLTSWAVCAALAGWNAVEYGAGKGPHGAATPSWLRWALAVPYFAVTFVGVRTVAAMVAGLAYLAAAGS